MSEVRKLVTGCGRSGTNYFAQVLNASGVVCGHEEVFRADGEVPSDLRYESSWYAAPYLKRQEHLTHVLHVVRHPRQVMASFYRIGMLSRSPVRHVSTGRPMRFLRRVVTMPRSARRRIDFVRGHRRFLAEHTGVYGDRDEVRRLETYWREWNRLVEAECACLGVRYLRVRLEGLESSWPEINDFLEIECQPSSVGVANTKVEYPPRSMPDPEWAPETVELAARYGYELA